MTYSWLVRGTAISTLFYLAALTPAAAMAAEKDTQVQIVNTYADLADLALASPVVVQARIGKAARLNEKVSPGIPAGSSRFLVTAAVERLLASGSPLPAQISYLVDVPLDSRGKPPKIKGSEVFLFLKPAQGRPGQFALNSRNGQISWSAEADRLIRSILTEASGNGADMKITGIGNAFYVPGTVPGESESQIFLTTADQSPVSLSVVRRPGEAPRWSVSLGEIVDEATRPASRDTLLWYRLACFLPGQLPPSVIASDEAGNGAALAADYAFILSQLGPCVRRLPQGQP